MSDIALKQAGTLFGFDLAGLRINDLILDDGLETAVIISLFTDRRVTSEELGRDGEDLRGWWADSVAPLTDGLIGSKLWLLEREKLSDETLSRARQYCLEALQWLLDEGIATELAVETEQNERGRMDILIEITRPAGNEVSFRYSDIWEGQSNGV